MLVLARRVERDALVLGENCTVSIASTSRDRVQLRVVEGEDANGAGKVVWCTKGTKVSVMQDVWISALKVSKGRVVLGIDAPEEIKVVRSEQLICASGGGK